MEPARREESQQMTERSVQLRFPDLAARRLRIGALIALGLAIFFVGWLIFGGDDNRSRPAGEASSASEEELREFAATASHPVYWAGPRSGQTYELTKTSDGRVYVRYLPEGVEIGDPRPHFLTVGTYPRANAFEELKRAARAEGAFSRELPQGGLAVLNRGSASVYFGYPDARYQVEVFAPTPGSARNLVLAGQVVPVR
jgi:hypothetical protein